MPTEESYVPNELDQKILSGEIPWREGLSDFRVLVQVLTEASRHIERNPKLAEKIQAKIQSELDEQAKRREAERQQRLARQQPRKINGYHNRAFEDEMVEIAVIDPGTKSKGSQMLPRLQWSNGWQLHYSERLDDPTSPTRTRGIAATKEGVVVALREAEQFLADHYTKPLEEIRL